MRIMKIMMISLGLFFGLSASSGAAAEADLLSPGYRECLREAALNVEKINQCQKNEYARLEADLNTAAEALMNTLDVADKGRLKEAQTAWSKSLDADVKFLALQNRSGLGGALAGAERRLAAIAQRAAFLRASLKAPADN